MNSEPKLYNVAEAAAWFGAPESTIRLWARSGELGGFKVSGEWRFMLADFLTFLEGRRREPLAS